MNTDSFIVYVKMKDIYNKVGNSCLRSYAYLRFKEIYTTSLGVNLQKEKTKKSLGQMKDELAGNIVKEFVGLRAKTQSYLIDDGSKHKKSKHTKRLQDDKSCSILAEKNMYLCNNKIDIKLLLKNMENS